MTLDPMRIRLPYQGWSLRRELTLFCKNFSNDKKCYKNGAIHQLVEAWWGGVSMMDFQLIFQLGDQRVGDS